MPEWSLIAPWAFVPVRRGLLETAQDLPGLRLIGSPGRTADAVAGGVVVPKPEIGRIGAFVDGTTIRHYFSQSTHGYRFAINLQQAVGHRVIAQSGHIWRLKFPIAVSERTDK